MINSTSKTICFLSLKHPPYDKRVFRKEARSLSSGGYQVIHLAPGNSDRVIDVGGVQIKTYRVGTNNIAGRFLNIPKLFFLALALKADCYHCNEPDSWIVGLLLKAFSKYSVVFDVHEHYSSRVAENYFPPSLQGVVSKFIQILFGFLSKFTDGLVFAKKSVASDFPKDVNAVYALNYTVSKEFGLSESIYRRSKDKPIIAVHMGLINKSRGWPQLVKAVKQLEELDLKIHIIGTFNDNSQDEFESTVDNQMLNDKFICESWMAFEDAFQRVLKADIGLILFQPGTKNHEFALPHKMFDYMLAGLPVIVPRFAEELRPIIEEEECGILVDTSNPDEIATAIKDLYQDHQKRIRMGEKGRVAALNKYNWENEEIKLLRFYKELFPEET